MKACTRFFCMAFLVMALGCIVSTTSAFAQFPVCNGTELRIENTSRQTARICVKGLGCYDVQARNYVIVGIPAGTQIPGVAGVANTTHTWQNNPLAPPPYWVPSLELPFNNSCYNIYFDDASCSIRMIQVPGPCQNQ